MSQSQNSNGQQAGSDDEEEDRITRNEDEEVLNQSDNEDDTVSTSELIQFIPFPAWIHFWFVETILFDMLIAVLVLWPWIKWGPTTLVKSQWFLNLLSVWHACFGLTKDSRTTDLGGIWLG